MRAGLTRVARVLVLAAVLAVAGSAGLPLAGPCSAAVVAGGDTAQVRAPTPRLPGVGAVDTVRTNVWLAQAVLAEVVAEIAAALPPAPGDVVVRPLVKAPGNALLIGAVEDLLKPRGYTIYLDERDIAGKSKPAPDPRLPAGSSELRLSCEEITLVYPRVGRRFGLWRQWVDRELSVTVLVTILDRDTGRMLYDERVTRAYGDRMPANRLDDVRSSAYTFTDAEVAEVGWRRRVEQTVVLGTLAGLVALYFANTGS
jgi:hypothetical protein